MQTRHFRKSARHTMHMSKVFNVLHYVVYVTRQHMHSFMSLFSIVFFVIFSIRALFYTIHELARNRAHIYTPVLSIN